MSLLVLLVLMRMLMPMPLRLLVLMLLPLLLPSSSSLNSHSSLFRVSGPLIACTELEPPTVARARSSPHELKVQK